MIRDPLPAIERELQCTLRPLEREELVYHNRHYRADPPVGPPLFVKVLSDHHRYYMAELRVAHHLGGSGFPTPRLLRYGELDHQQYWLAYEWHDFGSFALSPALVEEAGRLLGRLHRSTARIHDPRLRLYADIDHMVEEKAALIAEFDGALAHRVQQIHDRLSGSGASLDPQASLLHGDMGWRNLHTDVAGDLWLLDFEHAAIGHPLLDFAKLWDRELWDDDIRGAFLLGYRSIHSLGPETWTRAIDSVRLWAAAGIFPYARTKHDHAFESHAYTILDRLEGVNR